MNKGFDIFDGYNPTDASDDRFILIGPLFSEICITIKINTIRNYFIKKGFLNTEVNIKQERDTTITNSVILTIDINKNLKVKLDNIRIHGNINLTEEQVRRAMKETKEKRIYRI